MRNLAIAILKMAGAANIAASCRHHARDAASTLATLGLTPPGPKRTLRHYAEALTPTAPQIGSVSAARRLVPAATTRGKLA